MAERSVFDAIAEPHRRRILDLLRERERPAGELVDVLGLAQPTVSKHLRILRECGLVEARADAQRRVYRLRPAPLSELDAWLDPYRLLWSERLDALERHLDEMPLRGPAQDGRSRTRAPELPQCRIRRHRIVVPITPRTSSPVHQASDCQP